MHWEKPESYEARIKQGGCDYHFKSISIELIDWKKSRNNQARLGLSVDMEEVAAMSLAMRKDDAVFPAVLVYKESDSYVLIDGNHRAAAYKMCVDKWNYPHGIQVFEILADNYLDIDALTRSWNARESMGQTKDVKRAHIMQLLQTSGGKLTISRLSEQFSVEPDFVRDVKKEVAVANRLDEMNVRHDKPPHAFKSSHYRMLASIRDDELLMTVGACIKDYGLNTTQLQSLMQHIPKTGTLQKKRQAVATYLENYREVNQRKAGTTQPTNKKGEALLRRLRDLSKFLEDKPRLGDHEIDGGRVATITRNAARKLQRQLDELLT